MKSNKYLSSLAGICALLVVSSNSFAADKKEKEPEVCPSDYNTIAKKRVELNKKLSPIEEKLHELYAIETETHQGPGATVVEIRSEYQRFIKDSKALKKEITKLNKEAAPLKDEAIRIDYCEVGLDREQAEYEKQYASTVKKIDAGLDRAVADVKAYCSVLQFKAALDLQKEAPEIDAKAWEKYKIVRAEYEKVKGKLDQMKVEAELLSSLNVSSDIFDKFIHHHQPVIWQSNETRLKIKILPSPYSTSSSSGTYNWQFSYEVPEAGGAPAFTRTMTLSCREFEFSSVYPGVGVPSNVQLALDEAALKPNKYSNCLPIYKNDPNLLGSHFGNGVLPVNISKEEARENVSDFFNDNLKFAGLHLKNFQTAKEKLDDEAKKLKEAEEPFRELFAKKIPKVCNDKEVVSIFKIDPAQDAKKVANGNNGTEKVATKKAKASGAKDL